MTRPQSGEHRSENADKAGTMVQMAVLLLMALFSLLMIVGSIVLVPWLVVRMPSDFLVRDPPLSTEWGHRHPAVRIALKIAKNLLAYCVIAAGVAMLVLPGQGVLTIIGGLLLADFPGKHRFLRWLITRPPVLRGVNWLRERARREPLLT